MSEKHFDSKIKYKFYYLELIFSFTNFFINYFSLFYKDGGE